MSFNQPQQQQTTSLFGSTQPSTGLFGQQPSQQTSAFAPKPSTGLFGSSTTPSTTTSAFAPASSSSGLFGSSTAANTSTAAAPSTGEFSFNRPATTATNLPSATTQLFGSTPATSNTGLFGSTGATGTSGSLFNRPFGSSTTANMAAPTTTTSSLFAPSTSSILPSTSAPSLPMVAPALNSASTSLAPPLPALFTNLTTTTSSSDSTTAAPKSPVKFTPRSSFRIKPRQNINATPLSFGSTVASGTSTTTNTTTTLVPRKLTSSATTASLKKLIVADLDDFASNNNDTTEKAAIEEKRPLTTTTFTPLKSSTVGDSSILTANLAFGQLYMFPSEVSLHKMSPAERCCVRNFVIGKKGVGQIRFLTAVDLSDVDPDCIFGGMVQFTDGEAILYPDASIPKPAPGKGLNVPAEVRLERVWTFNRGSREPIIDAASEKVQLFVEKLKATPGTNFVDYEAGTGTWIFTVDHF